ncbi:F0F1 ATP synthase subunit B [uncultured Eubacterium sp.]|uniref:F0F1 ATP synthase subunit B n=1 Tax=uncultured Eubacterium sp. TaxID=165185 RepID=UPI00258E3DEE|nr:F0F1 ATP synthase subunit B [uncultured Eubacterium sp.]
MLKFDFNLLWTIVNLIIFYLLMRFFLIKPIKKTLQARKELIDNQFKEAEDTVNAANEKMADYEDKIKNVNTEAKEIISDARDKAKVEYNKILDKANNDATRLKQDAQKQIELDTENARRDVKEELAKLAMEAAQKVVGESVSVKTDAEIYDKFLNESSED